MLFPEPQPRRRRRSRGCTAGEARPRPDERRGVGASRRSPWSIASLADPPTDAYDAYLRLHLLSHRLSGRTRPTSTASSACSTTSPGRATAPSTPPRCRRSSIGSARARRAAPGLLRRQVPAHDRLRRPAGRADRRRRPRAPRRPPRRGHDGDARGVRELQRRHARRTRWSRAGSAPGVVVGDGSDVGGGASIMGTLSGGGTAVISIGERCLLGANSGLGISLGDDCVVEAGLYLTAGTRVTLPDGEVVKALELSGASNLLFRRNSQTGAVEACRARAPGAASTRRYTPAASSARRRARTPPASGRAPAAGSPRRPARRTSRERARCPRSSSRSCSPSARAREPEEERRVAARRGACPRASSAGSSTSRLAR